MSRETFGRDYYQHYIERRNASDPTFYIERKAILINTFQSIFRKVFANHFGEDWKTQNLKVLDVGSGENVAGDAISSLSNATIISVDLDLQVLKDSGNSHSVNAEAQSLPFADSSFDALVSTELIEHLESEAGRSFLVEAFRVLKPGGILYIETPNPQSLEAIVMDGDWPMYLDEHLTYYHPDFIKKVLQSTGFSTITAKTRYEKDAQINEAWKIIKALKRPILKFIPWKVKLPLVEKVLGALDKGSITVAIASKPGISY